MGLRNTKNGITVFELIIVIVIVAILAVVTIPKFMNLSSEAQTAATNAIAGALSSANASNYAARSASKSLGIVIANCKDVSKSLQGGLPAGYTINARGVIVNTTVSCTLNGPNSTTATFTATGIN